MSKQHTVIKSYSGGGPNAMSSSSVWVGSAETDWDQSCGASATTSLSPVLVIDPDSNCLAYGFKADGNCTLWFDGASTSTTDTSIALTANQPVIVERSGSTIAGIPTASDTYTLKLANATTVAINVDLRMLWS